MLYSHQLMISSRRHASLTRPIPNPQKKSPTKSKKKPLFYATSIDDFLKNQSMKPMVSQDQKVRQIEDNLTTSLIGLTDRWDIFNAYRNAFDQVIQAFRDKSDSMIKVKLGYDQFINSLKNENEAEVEKIENIKKTSDQSISNLTSEREKIKTKRESYHQLIDQVNTLNNDLNIENDELQTKIRNLMIVISEKSAAINEKTAQLTELNTNLTSRMEKKEKSLSIDQKLAETVGELNDLLKNLNSDVEKNLDSVYTHRTRYYELQKNTKDLNTHLKMLQDESNNKKEQISELISKKEEINSQIQQISDKTNQIIKQKEAITEAIKIIKEKSAK